MSKNKLKIIVLVIFILSNILIFSSKSNGYDWMYLSRMDKIYSTIKIFLLTGIGHIILYFIIKNIMQGKNEYKLSVTEKNIDYIKKIDPSLDVLEFKRFAFETFMKFEIASLNYDYESIRKISTDEFYNMTMMQLESSKITGNRDIITNIKYLNSGIIGISVENNIESINIDLMVSYKNREIENNYDRKIKNNFESEFIITFVRTIGTKDNKCPNCGSKLETIASNKCEYCKSVILSDNYGFVISKKNIL